VRYAPALPAAGASVLIPANIRESIDGALLPRCTMMC
jgi:hypothetical protein